eukprot:10354744-Karenia_brevis.AAC.1
MPAFVKSKSGKNASSGSSFLVGARIATNGTASRRTSDSGACWEWYIGLTVDVLPLNFAYFASMISTIRLW